MGRQLVPLTLDNLPDLPAPCAACVFWELDPVSGARVGGRSALEKRAWVLAVLEEWGTCGRVVYVDQQPAGFTLYAPPAYVPRSAAFPTSPVSDDAVQLTTAWIAPEFRGQGLGRTLVQAAAKDLLSRGVRAIEVFGDEKGRQRCVLPAEFLRAVGFDVVREHPAYPRLRLELRRLVWPAEMVEQALDRLLAGARARALRPS
jgi:ribosomal protein S18 acetylase RimI-like enzyme